MATNSRKHISVPKTFSLGDVDEWFRHFEICCKANEWNGANKAAKLPTLLEGEALAVWIRLSEEDKEDCCKAKKAIKSKLLQTTFTALEKFNGRLMLPSEKLPLFLHDLKRLLDQAMPGLTNKAREQLLLHQFLTGLPSAISKQLCSLGDKKAPDMTVERTQLLISIEKDHEQKGVAPISQEDRGSKLSEVTELKAQLIKLSEQVAALAEYNCRSVNLGCHAVLFVMELGIFSSNVSVNAFLSQQQVPDGAFAVDNWAISRRIARCRETTRGRPGQATGVPRNNWPRHKHTNCDRIYENMHSLHIHFVNFGDS